MIWLAAIAIIVVAGIWASSNAVAALIVTRAWFVLTVLWCVMIFAFGTPRGETFWVAVLPPLAIILAMRAAGWVVRAP